MLYNPKWDQHALLDQFIAWLETKDPDEAYAWWDPDNCACGQFFGSRGWQGIKEFVRLNSIAQGAGTRRWQADWTFGRCLVRAKVAREWEHLGYLPVIISYGA